MVADTSDFKVLIWRFKDNKDINSAECVFSDKPFSLNLIQYLTQNSDKKEIYDMFFQSDDDQIYDVRTNTKLIKMSKTHICEIKSEGDLYSSNSCENRSIYETARLTSKIL